MAEKNQRRTTGRLTVFSKGENKAISTLHTSRHCGVCLECQGQSEEREKGGSNGHGFGGQRVWSTGPLVNRIRETSDSGGRAKFGNPGIQMYTRGCRSPAGRRPDQLKSKHVDCTSRGAQCSRGRIGIRAAVRPRHGAAEIYAHSALAAGNYAVQCRRSAPNRLTCPCRH